ncbi:leucine-rich repeat and fibronectin type-III domain-containing protein hattifattener isoform X2 [Brevipalpus obovatus]|uniref:leucine-rich repeat and fibronectin type-III domain-containing protein hattifattener isoform X2 n=1 Tax=Brevipalpus obovatus TaxID=246614 RepID=UPI003D9DE061
MISSTSLPAASSSSSSRNQCKLSPSKLCTDFWTQKTMYRLIAKLFVINFLMIIIHPVNGQCPWPSDKRDLHSDCTCQYNTIKQLSIQCSPVNFTRLIETLHDSNVKSIPIEVLYINNASSLHILDSNIFDGLAIDNLHISSSGLRVINDNAFNGLNRTLKRLALPNNLLENVPTVAISGLKELQVLDLSANRINSLPDIGLKPLPLTELKLADNRLENISISAFAGLEPYLKNLNLKNTSLPRVPRAIENLTTLAFLDFAQNKIEQLESHQFGNLHSLTALNLERNKIKEVNNEAFLGVNDTLSSLSLLNNLLTKFPSQALSSLTELRVLDLGFNAIGEIPEDAFHKNNLLTLLALDGNPISTLPAEAFRHLRSTLRAISVGGKELNCDCRVSWIVNWMKSYNLQVSSRERNPQFCGKPSTLQRRPFSQISPEDLGCEPNITTTVPSSSLLPVDTVTVITTPKSSPSSSSSTIRPTTLILTGSSSTQAKSSRRLPSDWDNEMIMTGHRQSANDLGNDRSNEYSPPTGTSTIMDPEEYPNLSAVPTNSNPNASSSSSSFPEPSQEIHKIMNAYRRESSIIIEWDRNSLTDDKDLQLVYRFFGRKDFKKGPKLDRSSRRYVLPHLPSTECIIVCAVSTASDLKTLRVEDVPMSACREVRRERGRIADLDKVVIGATAALCAFVVMGIIMLTCCYRKDGKKKKSLPSLPPPPTLIAGGPCPMKPDNEWETVSMYSTRSIPRARMYHMDGGPMGVMNGSIHNLAMDDARSHVSNYSHLPNGGGIYGGGGKQRNMPPGTLNGDSQSHRSYSQLSTRFNGTCTLPHTDLTNKPSSLSNSHHQLHHTGNGGGGNGHHHQHHHVHPHANLNGGAGGSPSYITNYQALNAKKRSKSCNRLNSSSSMHSLTEYDSDWHNTGHHKMPGWKDNGVDVYVDKNQLLPNPINGKFLASR